MKIKIIILVVISMFFVNSSVNATGLSDDSMINSEISFVSPFNWIAGTSFNFSDDFFSHDSKIYNPEIAELSSILSAAAYNYNDEDNYEKYIEDALHSLDFPRENTRFYNYDKVYTIISNRVGYAFSYKPIEVDDTIYNLVVVVTRGTTEGEWYSNFAVSNGITYSNDVHYGFSSAEIKLNVNFQNYMREMELNKNSEENKILVTGHSRGAAVANLFAKRLTESQKFCTEDNLYAYTFGTPNVDKRATSYENIYNFVFNSDFVTKVPLSDWGFDKNGTTLEFFAPSDPEFENNELYTGMKENFYDITGKEFQDVKDFGFYENIIKTFNDLAPTIRDYYKTKTSSYPYKTLYEYTILMSYAMINGGNYSDDISALSTSMDESLISIAEDIISNDELVFAHSPETYIAWVRAYNDYIK